MTRSYKESWEALPGGEVLEVPCDYFLFQRVA
jgi:hypothetical protein